MTIPSKPITRAYEVSKFEKHEPEELAVKTAKKSPNGI